MQLLQPFEIDFTGVNLVEASAGTGKTYNITSLYIRALIENNIEVSDILVVTYTEAATKELKERLLQRIQQSATVLKTGEAGEKDDDFLNTLSERVTDPEKGVASLEKAIRMFDEASVYTIHGFCYRVLQEQAFESGTMYDAEMIGDDSDLVQEAVDDYWRRWVHKATSDYRMRPLLKMFREKGLDPETLAGMLGPFVGKPYLEVQPKDISLNNPEVLLDTFWDLHSEMKSLWQKHRSQLWELLNSEVMSNYRTSWLEGWFENMDEVFRTDTPAIALFDQFERFTQSRINVSLKKSAEKKGASPPEHPFFTLAEQYLDSARRLQEFDIIFKRDLLEYLRRELASKKEELRVLSYDDLLLKLRNALLNDQRGEKLAAKLREKYPIAMVDEFQDTDPNQYEIFRSIYSEGERALFMIGDPKQSIYSFRGADVFSYIKARKDAQENKRFRLDRNYRSTPKLLQGINTLWGRHENPFLLDEIGYRKVVPGKRDDQYELLREQGTACAPVRFRRLSEPGQEQASKTSVREQVAEDTAQEIRRLIDGGRKEEIRIGDKAVDAKDIAVLVRTHKQADIITEALRGEGIKSVKHSDQSVFESDEAGQLEYLLKAVAEPASESRIKTALSLPLTGYSAADLLDLEDDEEQWAGIVRQFTAWHNLWRDKGFAPMFRAIMGEWRVGEHLVGYPEGERRLTNMLHLGELLNEESKKSGEGSRSLLHWLARKRNENRHNMGEEEQLRLESDEELVKVVTMHKSKGLQYPVVFCPYLWDGMNISDHGRPLVYHRPGNSDTTYLDLRGKEDPARAEKRFYSLREELAESLRLAYVAMTRARQCLYISWEFANDSEYSSLGYLLQEPEQALALLKSKTGFDTPVEWSGNQMHFAIEKICRDHPDLFALWEKKEGPEGYPAEGTDTDDPNIAFHTRSFGRKRPLSTGYGISSFSSLNSWMDGDPDAPDYDQFIGRGTGEPSEEKEPPEKNIFGFPRGPQPGTCIHQIFEEMDFSSTGEGDGQLIIQNLERYGIDPEWKDVVSQMIDTVINKPLPNNGGSLRLSGLKSDSRLNEMEFYYRNGELHTSALLSIIRGQEEKHGEHRGSASSGFLKGFIDLTFRCNDRYYLLDYKTNHLGDAVSDYEYDNLAVEMREASYDLQYHLYTVALHRYLGKKLPGYSYEQHFGGAYYLFLRGINEGGDEGIYYDRPSLEIVETLNDYISGGAHE